MFLKRNLVPRLAEKILSKETLEKKRVAFEYERKKTNKDHIVEFFHDPSDPYSQLLEKTLLIFQDRYNTKLITHIVGPPDEGAAPERDKLSKYSRMDVMRLAKKAGFSFEFQESKPATNTFAADARLKKLGHYLGGTLYYRGEWYWGLDRLHYLEERLIELGLRRAGNGSGVIYNPPNVPAGSSNSGAELNWYLSFRSPYSAIVRERIKTLSDAYGAELKIRFVLPMVMRGLPVSPAKKKYIPLDAAREARRLDVPFGRIMDPVGAPVERGYSLFSWARSHGRSYEFTNAFLSSVWAEGVDAGSQRGLEKIVEKAGLNWMEAKSIVGNEAWRVEAETNRLEMMERGIWGVPSFRVGDTITWGQDRLWVIEHALKKHNQAKV